MRYFVPVPRIAAELPPQAGPEDKLGGLPWGLSPKLWPVCRDCGKSQSLIAQFLHHPERLDLGRPGRVLSVFICNHDPGMCETWDGGSGANACFITEPEDMIFGATAAPQDSPILESEARIVEWLDREDGIAEDDAHKFFRAAEFYELPETELDKPSWSTRLGGVPRWIQDPDEAPEGDWTFVGQLDSHYSFFQAPVMSNPDVVADPKRWEGRTHYCLGPILGDGGIGYIFVRKLSTNPEGWFFWQCG